MAYHCGLPDAWNRLLAGGMLQAIEVPGMNTEKTRESVPTYCALCVSRCGARAVVQDGRLVSLEADPSHPTGGALCIKGKAAPELVYHPERLLTPLKRTRPKEDPDPGWQAISWDEALDTVAARLLELSRRFGPEVVAFSMASPSTSATPSVTVIGSGS